MNEAITCQGRRLPQSDLSWLRDLVGTHPDWSRHQITKHLCRHWGWQTPSEHLKTFAARPKFDRQTRTARAPDSAPDSCRRSTPPSPPFPKGVYAPRGHAHRRVAQELDAPVHSYSPHSYEASCVGYYLNHHHYLGFTRTVGEHLKYLVRDRARQDLACLLFGSAAWTTAPRDTFIGWKPDTRAANLNSMTNNTRFLILPWVRVPNLASHLLGRVMRRLRQDWIEKYGHPVHLVETFVERDRFTGICYQAANWLYVGQTKGRSRQDRDKALRLPVKAIYLYPPIRHFRQALCWRTP